MTGIAITLIQQLIYEILFVLDANGCLRSSRDAERSWRRYAGALIFFVLHGRVYHVPVTDDVSYCPGNGN